MKKSHLVRYLTHPQVKIDPDVPVPEWALSETGRARCLDLAEAGWLAGTHRIIASAETKAVECAGLLAETLNIVTEIRPKMHENDRSATGFIPPDAFEAMADAFFGQPETSVRGWERAVDASARIVGEVAEILKPPADGDILIVGHGAVGTLLFCHLAGLDIDRKYDQPAGGGCYFSFTRETGKIIHPWVKMECPSPGSENAPTERSA